MSRGVREQRHELQQLDVGAGPAVRQHQRERPWSPSAFMDEMDELAINIGGEL